MENRVLRESEEGSCPRTSQLTATSMASYSSTTHPHPFQCLSPRSLAFFVCKLVLLSARIGQLGWAFKWQPVSVHYSLTCVGLEYAGA